MVNTKAIAGVAVVILLVIIGAIFVFDKNNSMTDDIEYDDVDNSKTTISDSVIVEKSTVEPIKNNPNYTINPDGTKSYKIIAKDSPDLGD